MEGHKICFAGEIWKIIPRLSLLPLFIWSFVLHLQIFFRDILRIQRPESSSVSSDKTTCSYLPIMDLSYYANSTIIL